MKKALIILLSLLFVVSGVLLVACNVAVDSIEIQGAPETVDLGQTVDYSKISIKVKFADGTDDTLKLTDKGVEHNNISTATLGNRTLTVTYKGKSAQKIIQVVRGEIDLDKATYLGIVRNTEGYREYEEAIKSKDNQETEFYNKNVVYTVGNDNGYLLLPEVSVRYEEQRLTLLKEEVDSTFKLSLKSGENFNEVADANVANYVSVENNIYYFTDEAVGKIFKLDVTVHNFNAERTISQVIEVVKGYNVYDALGLSVLDNKNVKSWADIKTAVLDWDNGHPLSYFTDVVQVVLHNNIKVTVDDLPDNYFWKEGEAASRSGSMSYQAAYGVVPAALRDYLPGSLKEVWLGEDWENGDKDQEQRGLYVSNGIGISGNCLMLSYDSNLDVNNKGAKGIYIVHDYKQTTTATNRQYPESHYSFMVYTHAIANDKNEDDANIKGTRTVKNVYFNGETQKTDDVSTPIGIMMLSADINGLKIINTIGTQWYCNAQLDGVGEGSLELEDCKFYESFSQMIFCYGIPSIKVTHCEMKRAGGPLFIIQTRTGTGSSAKDRNSVVTIDDTSNMESWLSGAETWFDINNLPATNIAALLDVATKSDSNSDVGTHYKKDGKANLIAVVIPDPGEVFTNQKSINGTINIGNTVYSMDDDILNAIIALNSISSAGSDLAQTTLDTIGSNASVSALKSGFAALASSPVMPVYKSGTNYGYYDGSKFHKLSDLQQLYGGSLQVQQQLQSAVPALATQWGNLAADANLSKVGQYSGATDTWNTGHLAFWVNPGGLNSKSPDLKLKHFMVLLGEGN